MIPENALTIEGLSAIKSLYNNAPCGYHSLNAEGIFTMINDTELKWLGYTRSEVVGKMAFWDMLPPESLKKYHDNFPLFKEKGTIRELEFDLICRDGTLFPASISSLAVYDAEGNYLVSRSAVFDLRKRKELEALLQQQNEGLKAANEALYALNQEKNRFLGIASHDLQNPLTKLYLLADKLEFTGKNLTPLQLKCVHSIRETVEQMTNLVRNLLNFNLIEQGIPIPSYEIINLPLFLPTLLYRFQHLADRKRIALKFECEYTAVLVKTVPSYLTDIIENLLSNALKFSPPDSVVFLRVHSQEAWAEVSIIDVGLGIKPEEMPLLFGKFCKLSTRPTAGENSTGLGLSIVKELITKIEADITCTSDYGHGATFTVKLPKA
ncbi:PAS domain-containing sensor histidine kinase [Runella slithyformis]|uniref:histidine kinase n=1 Tax=Runella slithyformis (strain ATCC 29530 / DSM 19594 / LMG 11500 / NCIMB 11436 / LSU 4) TaxID=761193 RepID=A0A7U3ZR69_RUNSL|nr:PAS domain-containing sensor histidine kinase [Runella slithyformis]AEI51818.1 PAS/PAC sensor signal transduction histidine kinase [Runella slithyformis DSM 19594]